VEWLVDNRVGSGRLGKATLKLAADLPPFVAAIGVVPGPGSVNEHNKPRTHASSGTNTIYHIGGLSH
jgi:hypothetical protein